MTSDLQRGLAPLSDAAWKAVDEEAADTLRVHLAARRLVDFEGPRGWQHAAEGIGRVERLADAPAEEVEARLRRVQALVELRVPFRVDREELESVSRGLEDPELDTVKEAARRLARAEDRAVFHGFPKGGIAGLASDSAHDPVSLTEDYLRYPEAVTRAIETLRQHGVEGPYGLALGPRCWRGLVETTWSGGYPVLEHVKGLVDGPSVWAPNLDGAALLSLRGGDFRLCVGRDASIGYAHHDRDGIELYLEESFTFRLLDPEAAVPLVYGP